MLSGFLLIQKYWFSGGFFVGGFSCFLYLLSSQPAPKWFKEDLPVFIKSKKQSDTRFGSIVELVEVDGIHPKRTWYFYSNSQANVQTGYASFSFLSTRDRQFGLSLEWLRRQNGLLGKLKWQKADFKSERRDYLSVDEAFRRALFQGEASALSQEFWAATNYLGISHLFVVSGFHLAVITGILLVVFSKLLFFIHSGRLLIVRLCVFLGVSVFYLYCQKDIALHRAYFCFLILFILPHFLPNFYRVNKQSLVWVLGAVFVFFEPLLVFRKGFYLSFAITAALFGLQKKSEVFCLPFFIASPVLYFFIEEIHFSSMLWNILLSSVFLFFLVPSLFFDNRIAQVFNSSVIELSDWLVTITPAQSLTPLMSALYLGMTAWIVFWGGPKLKIGSLCGLNFFVLAFSFMTGPTRNEASIQFVDVGQGDAILLRMGTRQVLIDGGRYSDIRKKISIEYGKHIDVWVLTHFDQDHSGFFEEFARRFSVGQIWITAFDQTDTSSYLRKYFDEKILRLDQGELRLCSKDLCLEGFGSPPTKRLKKLGNRHSLALKVYGKHNGRLLAVLTGDLLSSGERKWLATGALGRAQILKLGHHGSNSSSSAAFLDKLQPKISIATLGRANPYDFPDPRVLKRLQLNGIQLRRTDAESNIKINFDF